MSTPAAAAAVISPTEWPAPAPTTAEGRRPGARKSASRASQPGGRRCSGWATAVSRIVSASDSVPWATRSMPATADSQLSRSRQAGQLEPGGEEAGGLGALAGADDGEHVSSLSSRAVTEAVTDADEPAGPDLEVSYKYATVSCAVWRGPPAQPAEREGDPQA